MKFGIDCDGCISAFTPEVVNRANRMFGKNLPNDFRPNDWNYADVLTKDEWNQIWQDMMATENFWLTEKPLQGAEDLRVFLEKHPEAEVYFITSRPETKGLSSLTQCTMWLERYGLWPRFDKSQVIVVQAAHQKVPIILELGISHYLDDYAPTIESLLAANWRRAFLLDCPYNGNSTVRTTRRIRSVAEYLWVVAEDYAIGEAVRGVI